MHTTIYGYIEEMDFWVGPIKENVRRHNKDIISRLPIADKWPPVSQEMFSICENHIDNNGPDLEYFGRIIHFGANLKSVEYEWEEWRAKFEKLLVSLYFLSARVHFKTEYSVLQTVAWKLDLLKYAVLHDGTMPSAITPEYWKYESTYDT